ncbi:hypothetical protein [Methanoregula sp.]|uniref:hypothetical protein n=2 Tax=Methanoregula sp. TaxID=2052170 RepID=UPI003C5FB237
MKISIFVALSCAIVVLLATAGCTQTPQSQPTPIPSQTIVPTEIPTAVPTPVSTIPVPAPTTIAPAISLPTTIKDTPLLFTISAPEGYTGTSIRVISTGYTNDYKTTIYNPATQGSSQIIDDQSGNYSELADSLTIFSYSTSLDVSQNLRAFLRNSGTVFDESTVTSLNGITYTRFDTRTDPFTGTPDETVIYVGNQANANQKGYLPEMIYSVTPGGIINQETYENMIMSFQYYPSKTIGTAPGTETDKPTYYQ